MPVDGEKFSKVLHRSDYHSCLAVFRFEEEILTSQKAGDDNGTNSVGTKVIIGSNTFNQVQAQLNSQPPRAPEVTAVTSATQKPDSSTAKPRLTFSGIGIHRLFYL